MNISNVAKAGLPSIMDYLRMDWKQYVPLVRNEAFGDFDWWSQWLD